MSTALVKAKAAPLVRVKGWGTRLQPVAPLPSRDAMTPSYEGATTGRRTLGWHPGNDSVNTALFGAGDTLRARSRDMARKNSWAYNGIEVLTSEAIGTGIKPQSQHPDATIKAGLQQLWLDWTDECDATGTLDFYGLQALAFRSMIEGGECFVRLRPRRASDNLTVPLQLQLLESEHCPMWKNETLSNGNIIKGGIEFNAIGQRAAYWLYPQHPGERIFGLFQEEQLEPVRVPANQILHLFAPVRPGQFRGEPRLARALIRLYDYDQYTDAELMRKKTAALFAAFVTELDPEGSGGVPGNNSASLPGVAGGIEAPPGISFSGLEPGTIQKLFPGEDIKFSQPADVGAGFEPFNRAALREIAAAMGVTYEQLTGDLSGVNYSSIRAGLLAFRRRAEQLQHSVVVFQFCRPIWRAFLEAAVLANEIKARAYLKNQRDYLRVKWVAPGWQWVDPAKELQAAKTAVRSGFISRAQVVSQNGYDVEEIDREIAQDNARADELGLVVDTDPRKTADNGMRPMRGDPANPDGLQKITEPPQSKIDHKPSQLTQTAAAGLEGMPSIHAEHSPEFLDLVGWVKEMRQAERRQPGAERSAPPANIHVDAPEVNVQQPNVTVNNPPVTVNVHLPPTKKKVQTVVRDDHGRVVSVETKEEN